MGLEGRVDALVLTGDFAWSGETDEFRLARALIDELIKRLKLSLDHVLLVPGNHDMTWNPSPLAPAHDKQSVSRANYDDFIELLKQKRPTSESELLPIVSRSGRIKLRLLGLDSNRVEGPKAAGLGYVSPEAFHEAARLLEADPTDGFEQVFTWILVHHHVFPATSVQLEDALEKRVSLMGNALDLQQHAAHWQAEAILHGHEHQPSVTVAARWPVELGQQFTPLTVIGAGSFSAKRDKLGPFSRNHYYVLYRRAEDIIVRSRQLGESLNVFVPHNDMILPQQPRPWGTRASQKRATGEAVGPGPMPAAV
jgi:3',5'-cyclic AMP phosphodiesterase CpdA